MIALINIGRALMAIWIIYGLVLIFTPGVLHRPPDELSGAIQVGIAFALGYLMDRGLSVVHKRRASADRDVAPPVLILGADETTSGPYVRRTDPGHGAIGGGEQRDAHGSASVALQDFSQPGIAALTKRCPFCAEEILAAAIKCKYCKTALADPIPNHAPIFGSDDKAAATAPVESPLPRVDYGWGLLGVPIIGVILMWAVWIASTTLPLAGMLKWPAVAVRFISISIVIGTGILAGVEARQLGMTYDRKEGTYNPIQWAATVLGLWLIGYPCYLYKRRRFGRKNLVVAGLLVTVIFLVSSGMTQEFIEEDAVQFQPAIGDHQSSRGPHPSVPQTRFASKARIKWPTSEAAERQAASYCGQIVDRNTKYETCRAREIAAWKRLGSGAAFRTADTDAQTYCTGYRNYSFESEETCLGERSGRASQQINPREFIGYGSRAGDELTIISKKDVGTDHGVIRAHLTRENAKHHCEEYDNNSSIECVDGYMKDGDSPKEIVANCVTGIFTTFWGNHLKFSGKNPETDAMAKYTIRDLDGGGKPLDGSSASGYPTVMEQFIALCPNKGITDE